MSKGALWRSIQVGLDVGVDDPVHPVMQGRADRIERLMGATLRAEAIRVWRKIRFEERLQQQLRRCLDNRSRMLGMPNGRSPPFSFGMYTRRTGPGRYVFVFSSSRNSASKRSRPSASISSKVQPSGPGAPPFAFASAYACATMSARYILS
jgi:hypothetical protein